MWKPILDRGAVAQSVVSASDFSRKNWLPTSTEANLAELSCGKVHQCPDARRDQFDVCGRSVTCRGRHAELEFAPSWVGIRAIRLTGVRQGLASSSMQHLLSMEQLAEFLGLSVQTIYNRRNRGGPLPRSSGKGRAVRYCMDDVRAWLANDGNQLCELNVPTPQAREEAPRRLGRPTKQEQVRRRMQAAARC